MTPEKLAVPSHPHASCSRQPGRLILVTCPDPARLDLVLKAVCSRLARLRDVVIAEPVVTRSLPAGSGIVVSRRTFAAFESAGTLCLAWSSGGRTLGYTTTLLDQLAGGSVVVAAAGREVEERARALWLDVRIVRLDAGTEMLRGPLSPARAMARHQGGSRTAVRLGGILAEGCDWRVRDLGDLASAVRELTAAIEMQLPPAARVRGAMADFVMTAGRAEDEAPRDRFARTLGRHAQKRTRTAKDRAAVPHSRAVLPT